MTQKGQIRSQRLMSVHFSGLRGLFILLGLLIVPGLIPAYVFRSAIWIAVVPGVLILLMLAVAALPIRKKITPQQFADALEPHLLGTDGNWGWDDATSVRLADERLEQLRVRLGKFDILVHEELREEFREIIAALRRGDVPEIKDDYDSADVPRFRSL